MGDLPEDDGDWDWEPAASGLLTWKQEQRSARPAGWPRGAELPPLAASNANTWAPVASFGKFKNNSVIYSQYLHRLHLEPR